MHVKPVRISLQFTVDESNTNGLGIKNLKGPTVAQVFMHSTAGTPSTLPGANPAAGTIVVQLQDGYNQLLGYQSSTGAPNGTPVLVDASDALLTVGEAYTITTVGDATLANWQALGVPKGVTPAVGVVFIALATGAGTSATSAAAPCAAAGSGIFDIQIVGDPNQSIAPSPAASQGYGAQFVLKCFNDSSGDAPEIHQPADGSRIYIELLLSDSSVITNATQSSE